jgi:hypothetical protein
MRKAKETLATTPRPSASVKALKIEAVIEWRTKILAGAAAIFRE